MSEPIGGGVGGCYTDFKDEDTEAHGINNLLKAGCKARAEVIIWA